MTPDNDAFEGLAPGGDELEATQKAKLDDSELSDALPKSLQKVDLDLDDAPFLDDEPEEPEQAAPPPSQDLEAVEGEEAPVPLWKKKWFLPAAAGVLLLLIAGAVNLLLFDDEEPPPPPPPQEEIAEEETPPPPEEIPVEKPPVKEILVTLAPFLVEKLDDKGRTRFLSVKFSITTTSMDLEREIKNNLVVLRDAIYYYLKNKNLTFLTDKNNTETLKQDVLSVVNQFLSSDQIDNLLIEDYLVK